MRVLERLDELYAIGGGPGANRPHPGAGEDEAHELAAEWMRQAGLDVEVDSSGNLRHAAERQDVWVGSHLDTVPQGGRFDGALGVIAGLEAVERTGRGTVVSFRGEEVGCVGSRARCAAPGHFRVHSSSCTWNRSGARERRCSARRRLEHRRLRPRRAVFDGEAGHAGPRRWTFGRTRSWMRRRQSCGSGTRHARSRVRWRR